MATGKLLRKLIQAGTEGNTQKFQTASEEIIEYERSRQHHLLANDLERLLNNSKHSLITPINSIHQNTIPLDSENELPLIEIKHPKKQLDNITLSTFNREIIERILLEHRRQNNLTSYGLKATQRILLFGPPGCGKTLTAEAIANELDLPFGIVRTDGLMSSLLGSTSSNLRKVFDFITSNEIVVLFDEFDSIGKSRSDLSDHGELKRVVNTFLQMSDNYNAKSIIIAATNHETSLDPAIWRRFEEVLLLSHPTHEEILHTMSIKLRGVRRDFDYDDIDIDSYFKGMSHADIDRILTRSIKTMVLENREFLTENIIRDALESERFRIRLFHSPTQ